MNPTRIAAALCAALAVCPAALPAASGLPSSTPERQGVSSQALLGFIDAAEHRIDALHSFVLVRHGSVVAQGWWAPYAADEPHLLFSLSKSFTSTAVGLAIAEGKLSLSDPVLKFFPEEAPASPSKNLQSMRVRDLLRMCSGQSPLDIQTFPFGSKDSLVRRFLALPVPDKPGTHFIYNTAATYMLSAIVQKVTGQTVLEYLKPRLFTPLGIDDPQWQASAEGISLGGFGLSLRTGDIAKFGQLYLQHGAWNGRQLIPASWVDQATTLQTANGSDPDSDWDQGYCYQFWRCTHGFYRGDGAHGQYCVVMPQYDAVIAITAGTKDLPGVLKVVWETVLPAFHDGTLPADPASDQQLAARLGGLRLAPVAGSAPAPSGPTRRFAFPANDRQIDALALEPASGGSGTVLDVRIAGVDQKILCAAGGWAKGSLRLAAGDEPVAASGAWISPTTFSATLVRYRTPFSSTMHLSFSGDAVQLQVVDNVGVGAQMPEEVTGTAQPGS